MIFHVKLNGSEYEVDAASAAEAIVVALDTYTQALLNEPDQCLQDDASQGLCVCAQYAGELNSATPAP